MNTYIKVLLILFMVLAISCGTKKDEGAEGANTAPFIRSVTLLPEEPILGSRIMIRIDAGDNEGDKITFTVKWFLNNKEIGEGIECYLNEAKRGDKIRATVTPSDGELTGETVESAIITIGNSPPKIISATITPDAILTSTGDLTVIGQGYDPDGDALRWLCYWVLDYSTRIGDSSVTFQLKNQGLKKGSHLTAELYAFDGDTVSTAYLLEIDVVNSPPVLREGLDSIPYTPDSIYYEVPIVDPDEDPLTFEIVSGPAGLSIDREKGIIHGSVIETEPFDIVVRARDNDGAYLDARFTLIPPEIEE